MAFWLLSLDETSFHNSSIPSTFFLTRIIPFGERNLPCSLLGWNAPGLLKWLCFDPFPSTQQSSLELQEEKIAFEWIAFGSRCRTAQHFLHHITHLCIHLLIPSVLIKICWGIRRPSIDPFWFTLAIHSGQLDICQFPIQRPWHMFAQQGTSTGRDWICIPSKVAQGCSNIGF